MRKYLFQISIFIALFIAIPSPSMAGSLISCILRALKIPSKNQKTSEITQGPNSTLYRYIHSPAVQRWKSSPDEGWKILHKKISDVKQNEINEIVLRSKSFVFMGNTKMQNSSFILTIEAFTPIKSDQKKPNWVITALDEDKRSEGLNASFAHLFGVTINSLQQVTRDYPNLTSIRIEARKVISGHLEKLLSELGFQRTQTKGSSSWFLELKIKDGQLQLKKPSQET